MRVPIQYTGVNRVSTAASMVRMQGMHASRLFDSLNPIKAARYSGCLAGCTYGGGGLGNCGAMCNCVVYDDKDEDWCVCRFLDGFSADECKQQGHSPNPNVPGSGLVDIRIPPLRSNIFTR